MRTGQEERVVNPNLQESATCFQGQQLPPNLSPCQGLSRWRRLRIAKKRGGAIFQAPNGLAGTRVVVKLNCLGKSRRRRRRRRLRLAHWSALAPLRRMRPAKGSVQSHNKLMMLAARRLANRLFCSLSAASGRQCVRLRSARSKNAVDASFGAKICPSLCFVFISGKEAPAGRPAILQGPMGLFMAAAHDARRSTRGRQSEYGRRGLSKGLVSWPRGKSAHKRDRVAFSAAGPLASLD